MAQEDNKLEESLRKNAAQDSFPTYNASEGKEKEFQSTEESLSTIKTAKLEEECDDARHSLQNTKRLNTIYSQLMCLFFGGRWFYLWVLSLFILFVIADDEFVKNTFLNEYINDVNVILVCKKLFYALGIVFVALLTFPTAKGLRRLFKTIVDILKHKIKL